MKHTFSTPVTFEDVEYTELDLDLESLKGEDVADAERDWTAAGNFAAIPSISTSFCALIAARASKQPIEMIKALPAREYTKLCQAVSNFLMQ